MPAAANKRTFDKAERILIALDEKPELWRVYGETIKGIIEQANQTIADQRASIENLRGITPEQNMTVRGLQIRWKKKLWEERAHRCERCGLTVTWPIHRIHHKVSVSDGGQFTDENLEVLCIACHLNGHAELHTPE